MLALAACGGATANRAGTTPGYDFPALTGRVVDRAQLLKPIDEERITRLSQGVEKATGHQIVVVTVTSLKGRSIEQYGRALGNHWHIGRKGFDDGVLLVVALREHKVRIEVGKGLEKMLTNAEAAAIIRDDILPNFGAGDIAGGIEAGVFGIVREIVPARKAA